MGKKKKKREEERKPWCYYCDRDFADETTLILHQKARHFKCAVCHKKMTTAPSLAIHCSHVHKTALTEVPNSKTGRGNIELEIFGMAGIPDEAFLEGPSAPLPDEPSAKVPRVDAITLPPPSLPPPQPGRPAMFPQPGFQPPPAVQMQRPMFSAAPPPHHLVSQPPPGAMPMPYHHNTMGYGQPGLSGYLPARGPPGVSAPMQPLFPIAKGAEQPPGGVLLPPPGSRGPSAAAPQEVGAEALPPSDAKLLWLRVDVSMEEARAEQARYASKVRAGIRPAV